MKIIFKNLLNTLIELLFPSFCLNCKKGGNYLCLDCKNKICCEENQKCPLCFKINIQSEVCFSCQKPDFYLDGLITITKFEQNSIIQKCIHALKYEFIENLAQDLAEILFSTLQKQNMKLKSEMISFVPLHKKRLYFRGFNQAELLAKNFCNLYNKNDENKLKVESLLERIHFDRPQMELGRDERISNMIGAFQVQKNTKVAIKNSNITIIDDVATTLSTLNACAKVLKEAGAKKVYGLVLARA